MTSAVETRATASSGWQLIVFGGVRIGIVTAIGVAAFSLLSTALAGPVETVVQSLFVLAGGALFAYWPAAIFGPRDVDGIAWTAMIGLLGAVSFTVIDTAALRSLDLYHWTWDAIGGGSGFWYVPVWFMASAVLAWLGGWVRANSGSEAVAVTAAKTVGIGIVLAAVLIGIGLVPFHAAGIALAYVIGLVIHVPLSAMMGG